MTCLKIAQQYIDAWNAHDANALLKTFASDGTYQDPTTGRITGKTIGYYAKALWRAFPDLLFEIVSIEENGPNQVVVEWIMRGTNTGSNFGIPPTGRPISLSGVDVMQIGSDGIKALKGYFDAQAIPEQLGYQVSKQLHQEKRNNP